MKTPPKPGETHSILKKAGLVIANIVAILLSFAGVIAILGASANWYNERDWNSSIPVIISSTITIAFVWLTCYLNSFLKAPPAMKPLCCQSCGVASPLIKVGINRHIGAIILMFHKSLNGYLCKRCIKKAFWEFTPITLLFGWWGLLSVIITPIVLITNLIAYVRSLRIAEPNRA